MQLKSCIFKGWLSRAVMFISFYDRIEEIRVMAMVMQADVREAVAVFDAAADLQAAIDELLSSGFNRAELSLLASAEAIDAKIGRVSRAELEDNAQVPRGVYVSPDAIGIAEGSLVSGLVYLGGVATAGIVALAGGPLTAVIIGAALAGGAGGLVGAGFAELLGHHRAAYFDEQLERGGLLLWVRTEDRERELRAVEILSRHSGKDVHVHGPEAPRLGGEQLASSAESMARKIVTQSSMSMRRTL
jgi:hypothetical protein